MKKILAPIYSWDSTLKNLISNINNILPVYSEDIKFTNRKAGRYYNGFDLDALCRYETLASMNVSMGDYKSKAIDFIDKFIDIFNTNDIDTIISWNPVLSFRKIPIILAKQKGIKTIVLDYSAFKGRLIKDEEDVSVYSKFYRDYVNYYRYLKINDSQIIEVNNFIENYKNNKITRISDIDCNNLIDIKNFSLVILQVQNDANILYYQNQIINNNTILKYLKENSDKKFLIRNHPLTENKDEVKKYFYNYGFIDDFKMHNLLDNCSEVITINSSVGIEALCYNKPVIALGNAVYNKVINNKHFLWYYLNKFTIKIEDINYIL